MNAPDGQSRQTTFTRETLAALGFELDREYADGVSRWTQWATPRLELVVFIEQTGLCPCGIQVWVDGIPQDLRPDRARV